MTDDSGNKSENEIEEEGLTNDWWQWKQEWERNRRRRTYKWLMAVETRVRTK